MHNPEFGVGHLEKWAEMLHILKDISGNRMPNVADLLKQSSQAKLAAASPPSPPPPMAGQIKGSPSGAGQSGATEAKPKAVLPKLVDAESSQQPAKNDGEPEEPGKKTSA